MTYLPIYSPSNRLLLLPDILLPFIKTQLSSIERSLYTDAENISVDDRLPPDEASCFIVTAKFQQTA